MTIYNIKELIKNEDKSDYQVENERGDIRVQTKIEQEVITSPEQIYAHLSQLKKERDQILNDTSEDGINKRKAVTEEEIDKKEEEIKNLKDYYETIGTDEELKHLVERKDFLNKEIERLDKIFNEAEEKRKKYEHYELIRDRLNNLCDVVKNWEEKEGKGYTEKGVVSTYKDLKPFIGTQTTFYDIEINGKLEEDTKKALNSIIKKYGEKPIK